ncbi:hypothetical protein B0H10DRAFT_1959244 [Mycena sp. CBHHK59/15]|nr:hypothetical protein B0H10DRAFT_1959244 [Mycena sp. CBHHK59/15]
MSGESENHQCQPSSFCHWRNLNHQFPPFAKPLARYLPSWNPLQLPLYLAAAAPPPAVKMKLRIHEGDAHKTEEAVEATEEHCRQDVDAVTAMQVEGRWNHAVRLEFSGIFLCSGEGDDTEQAAEIHGASQLRECRGWKERRQKQSKGGCKGTYLSESMDPEYKLYNANVVIRCICEPVLCARRFAQCFGSYFLHSSELTVGVRTTKHRATRVTSEAVMGGGAWLRTQWASFHTSERVPSVSQVSVPEFEQPGLRGYRGVPIASKAI